MNKGLWIAQGLLALLFLFTAITKLVLPVAALESQMPVTLPGAFLRFLGVAELLGAFGLILPALLRFRPWLTPLAAACLVIIMIGATAYTIAFEGIAPALLPLVTGVIATFVAYGRWRLAPITGEPRLPLLRTSAAQS